MTIEKPILTRGSAILVAVFFALPVYLLFSSLGYPGKGSAASISAIALIGTIGVFRDKWRFFWFWITIVCLLLLHVGLIFVISWPNENHLASALAGQALVDFALCYGCISLVEKLDRD